MNQAQFAKLLNVSKPYITKLINEGRLNGAFTVDAKGRRDIDPKKAKALLDHSRDPAAKPSGKGGRPKGKGKGKKRTPSKRTPPPEEKIKTVVGAGLPNQMDYGTARTLNEKYKAALKNLEYEEKRKALTPTAEIVVTWTRHIIAAKTRLLGLKSRLAPIVFEHVEDLDARERILTTIDQTIREALKELGSNPTD